MTVLSPLLHAIQARDLSAAMSALERDPSQATTEIPGGLSPLMFALYNGAHDIAELLKSYRSLNLYEAASFGDSHRVAELVISDKALLTNFSPDGWTALHLAAFFGKRDALLTLIGLGAPLDEISQNPIQNTPMQAAIAGSDAERLAPLMIALGADITHVGGSGVSTLHLAASRGLESLCKLLLNRGANRLARTEDGKTAAELARDRNHLATAAMLELAIN